MEQEHTEYTLTDDEQAMVLPIIEQVNALQGEAQTILRAISRARRLEGNWMLEGVKLIKQTNGNGANGAK